MAIHHILTVDSSPISFFNYFQRYYLTTLSLIVYVAFRILSVYDHINILCSGLIIYRTSAYLFLNTRRGKKSKTIFVLFYSIKCIFSANNIQLLLETYDAPSYSWYCQKMAQQILISLHVLCIKNSKWINLSSKYRFSGSSTPVSLRKWKKEHEWQDVLFMLLALFM